MRTLMNNTLPDGWRESSIFKEAPLQRGFDLPAHSVINGPYPVIGSNGIIFHHNAYMCEGPGLITGRSGTIGKFTFIPKGQYWPHNTSLWVTNFNGNDPKFVYYLYHTLALENYLSGSGVPTLNRNLIHNIAIQIPPLSEQTRIASALTSIDNLISSLDKLIEKKKAIKEGTMQQLLTGKKRLKGFNEPWVMITLGEICEFRNGYTPSKRVKSFWDNGTIPWFRMEDIRDNGRILSNSIQHVTPNAIKGELFSSNSIILSTTATIGEHALLIADSLANQQFTNLKIRKSLVNRIDIMWFYWYCFIIGEWCRHNIHEGGLAAVNISDLSKLGIVIPSIEEQKKIASILSSMDNQIAFLEAKRNKYIKTKQGMMQQLLTGRIRLV